MNGKIYVGTHNGIFHRDEVVAVAVIKLFFREYDVEIIRTRDKGRLEDCDVVTDVGGGELDHHIKGFNKKRVTGEMYASAGLTWEKYGRMIIRDIMSVLTDGQIENVFQAVDKDVIIPVDNDDNGDLTTVHKFSFLEDMLPVWSNEPIDLDAAFNEAVEMSMVIIKKVIQRHVAEELASGDNFAERVNEHIAEIPNQLYPWQGKALEYNNVYRTKAYFVIFPYFDGGWAAQCIPPSADNMNGQLVPFPKAWSGLNGENLAEVSGVQDAILCHNFVFFARAKSKEGVIKMCQAAMEKQQ